MVIYGWGYQGRTLDELREHQRRLNALIVDVRLVPQSRTPEFRRAALIREFSDDYLWVRAFGNVNYKAKVGDVHLLDPVAGVGTISNAGVSAARPALLLCVCRGAGCHRVAVARFIIAKFGGKFVDLSAGLIRMPGHEDRSEEGQDG